MNNNPTLLILSPRFPFPIEKGDKLRLYHQILYLSQYFKIILVSLSEQEVDIQDRAVIESLVEKIYIIKQSPIRYFKALVKSLIKNEPIQISYYHENKIQNAIHSIIQENKPDLIFAQLIRMAPYLKDTNMPIFMDYMDAMSLNMERESNISSFPKNIVFARESRLLKKAEVEYAHYFQGKSIISNQDEIYLNKLGIKDLLVQQNGVDIDFFNKKNIQKPSLDYDVVFVGNMGYLPNVKAAIFLVNEIIIPFFPEAKVLIAGARPHQKVKKLASKNIKVSGWIEDIRSAYLSAKMVVAPIFTGAGQQNKLLEGMALSCACITTKIAAEAISAENNKHLFVANTPEEYKIIMEELWTNEAQRIEIGKNARIFVEQNFQWKDQIEQLKNALVNLIK